jgi:putative transposase
VCYESCAKTLLCQLQRTWMVTTDSHHGLQTYPNLLMNLSLTRPNPAWVTDITSIRLPSTFIYLACVLDAWPRRCVGWELSRSTDTQLTLAALNHAIALRQPAARLIHHSDRGVQYASTAYVERLLSIGRRSVCRPKATPITMPPGSCRVSMVFN